MCGERTPYIHRHVVCVCIYNVSQSKREIHPFPQEGGREIEWPYIHKEENHPVPQGGGWAGSLSSLARTVGGGDAAGSRAQNRGGGGGDAAEAEGYPFPQGKTAGGISYSTGGGGEYTMTSITYIEV